MSLKDRSTDELLKQKKKYKFGVWAFAALLILLLFLNEIEQISVSTGRILFLSFTAIILINVLSSQRINKELKRRENTPKS
jgi:uncharacterized membrane protein